MSLYQVVETIQKKWLRSKSFSLRLGDTVRVGVLVQERNKQRVQNFQGTLIAMRHSDRNSTFTIRRVFQGTGLERVFLFHSPVIKRFEVLRRAKVRRAKLYFLRHRKGKGARLRKCFKK